MKPQSKSLLTMVLGAGVIASGLTLPPAAYAASSPVSANILDVNFGSGAPTDNAQDKKLTAFGTPVIDVDSHTGRPAADFDGKGDAYSYPMSEADYADLGDSFSVECSFKYDGALPSSEVTLCGNKQGGGFALIVKNDSLSFMLHAEGGYKHARTTIEADRWYHVTGAFDGKSLKLYVDGKLAAETAAAAPMTIPADAGAHQMVIGADSAVNKAEAFADVVIGEARLYGKAMPASQVQALSKEFHKVPQAPAADVLDVDFADGTAADKARGLSPSTHDAPTIAKDGALGRNVASFDGQDDAFAYPVGDQYAKLGNSMTMECVFRYDGELPKSGERNLCANKEGGGFSMTMYGETLTFAVHTGAYSNAGTKIEAGRWYHAVGVYDGTEAKLYVNGELAASVPAKAAITWPSNPGAHNLVLGADSSNSGVQFHAEATIASARIFGSALTAGQVAGLNTASLGQARDKQAELLSSIPAEGQEITEATKFELEWNTPDLVASNLGYTLDGKQIAPGDMIAGLESGRHTLEIQGADVFGRTMDRKITFTSGSIPDANGVETGQGKGTVTLSANATNPDGGDVTSTFFAGSTEVATGGTTGLLGAMPTTLDFDHVAGEADKSAMAPNDDREFASKSAAKGQIPFQRFDVAVGAGPGQSVRWSGEVDPQREGLLWVWNVQGGAWEQVAQARGLADAQLVLSGEVDEKHIDAGNVHVMVTAVDPFADDLEEPVRDSFEDPEDYDFSMVHFTDTQYLSEGAVEASYSKEQQEVWKKSYTAIPEWIAENAAAKKIKYVTHTGDIIENWHAADYANEAEMEAIALKEFEFASDAQRILEDTGIPNGVLPGNHDNRTGTHNGPGSMYNQFFGPERYETLEKTQGWKDSEASYQAWAAGDNDNHYDLFSAGGLDFIGLYLGFDVTDEEIAWANEVLEKYSDRNAMLLTHAYNKPSYAADGRGAAYSHDGKRISEGILEKHKNVFLVLSGHEHGVSIEVRKDVGQQDNNIVELLADYQFYEVSAEELGLEGVDGRSPEEMLRFGASYLRMLQFDVDRAELAIDTYSPLLGDFGASEYDDEKRYNGTEDDLRLPIQLETRKTSFSTDSVLVVAPTSEEIGAATVRSGWPASVQWSDLSDGEVYSWYVTSTDAQTDEELSPGSVKQLGVFTARPAGTDTTAPVITLPQPSTLKTGAAFDPLAGVGAHDDTDGDVSADINVSGSVDTATPGSYALTYMVQDTNGNQAIASRAVVVEGEPVVEEDIKEEEDGTGSGIGEDGADEPQVPQPGDEGGQGGAAKPEQQDGEDPAVQPQAGSSPGAQAPTAQQERANASGDEPATASETGLAATGAAVLWTMLGGFALAASGAVLLWLRKRKAA